VTLSTTYEHVIVSRPVASLAQRNPIADLIAQFGISGKRFDVMGMQLYRLAVAIVSTAVLTGVTVALIHTIAPLEVFIGAAIYFVLCALTPDFIIVGLSVYSTALNGIRRSLYELTLAAFATCDTDTALRFVFSHAVAAHRAIYHYLHTGITNGFHVGFDGGLKAISASLAGFTDTSRYVFVNHVSILSQVAALNNVQFVALERLLLMGLAPERAEA